MEKRQNLSCIIEFHFATSSLFHSPFFLPLNSFFGKEKRRRKMLLFHTDRGKRKGFFCTFTNTIFSIYFLECDFNVTIFFTTELKLDSRKWCELSWLLTWIAIRHVPKLPAVARTTSNPILQAAGQPRCCVVKTPPCGPIHYSHRHPLGAVISGGFMSCRHQRLHMWLLVMGRKCVFCAVKSLTTVWML